MRADRDPPLRPRCSPESFMRQTAQIMEMQLHREIMTIRSNHVPYGANHFEKQLLMICCCRSMISRR